MNKCVNVETLDIFCAGFVSNSYNSPLCFANNLCAVVAVWLNASSLRSGVGVTLNIPTWGVVQRVLSGITYCLLRFIKSYLFEN